MLWALDSAVFTWYRQRMETVTVNIRVHRSLRDAFLKCCEQDDNTASRVLRAAMRDYIAAHAQLELKPIGRPRKPHDQENVLPRHPNPEHTRRNPLRFD
jgi:hypothetical protein